MQTETAIILVVESFRSIEKESRGVTRGDSATSPLENFESNVHVDMSPLEEAKKGLSPPPSYEFFLVMPLKVDSEFLGLS